MSELKAKLVKPAVVRQIILAKALSDFVPGFSRRTRPCSIFFQPNEIE